MKYKLIVFDMGGVIFSKVNNIWFRVHDVFGTLEEGKILTEKYLYTDYDKLVEEVVIKLWNGKDCTKYFEMINSIAYSEGVNEALNAVKDTGAIMAIVSASSLDLARRVQKDFPFFEHIYANELVIKNNKITGEFIWPIGSGREKKAEIIENLCEDLEIDLSEVLYIGDSSDDREAFKLVGTSIAFNSKDEELKKIATFVVDSDNLSEIIPYLN